LDDSNFQGFKALDKKLRALGQELGGQALRQSLSAAVTPVVNTIRRNAPVGKVPHRTYTGRLVLPGFLSRNIKKRSRLSKDRRRATVEIGVSAEAFYGPLFLELGTKHIAKDEWMTQPFEQGQGVVINRLWRELIKRINRIVKR